jgi:hypothetical protein
MGPDRLVTGAPVAGYEMTEHEARAELERILAARLTGLALVSRGGGLPANAASELAARAFEWAVKHGASFDSPS